MEGFKVVVDARDWDDDGVHHGYFDSVSRRNADGVAHGGGSGDGVGGGGDSSGGLSSSVVLKLEAITVRLHRG